MQQSLIETIAGGTVNDGMHHMAVALGKLTNLEGFVRQVKRIYGIFPSIYSICDWHLGTRICHMHERGKTLILNEQNWQKS